jgi:hypothetical protein
MTGPEDQSITGLIRRGLSSAGGTGAAGECPEPEVLAAYYDRALEPEEAARAEAHFSDCAACRAQLAALVRSDVPERKARGFAWLWDWRVLVPAAALGAGVLAVWIAVRPPLHSPQQVAEVKTIPAETPKTAENPLPPPPPAVSAEQSPPATGTAERRKPAGTAGGKTGSQSRAVGGEERREGLAADKVVPESPGAPAEETKKEAQMVQADTNREAAPSKPLTPPAAAAPSVAGSPSTAGAFANKPYAGGAVRGETKREKAFAAVSGAREVRIPSPDPLVIWRVVRDGILERSEDGGAAWRVQIQKPAAALLAGSAPSAKVCWVVGRAGIVLRTTDGEHWTKVSSPAPVDLVDVKAADGAHATVTAADGRVFATADGGETWQPAP